MEPRRDDRSRPFLITADPGSERGASAVEYSMLVALVAAVVIVAVVLLGDAVLELFASVQWW